MLKDQLIKLKACSEAVEWVGKRSLAKVWRDCQRADWMLWYLHKTDCDRKLLVKATCACARTALKYVPRGELRPLRAIETAEAWTQGEATLDQVKTAASAAYAACAVYAADAVALGATSAAYFATSAASSLAAPYVAYAVSAAAKQRSHKEMSDIIRSIIPEPMSIKK